MDAKTIVAVVLVAFIIGGFIFLQIKNRKKYHELKRSKPPAKEAEFALRNAKLCFYGELVRQSIETVFSPEEVIALYENDDLAGGAWTIWNDIGCPVDKILIIIAKLSINEPIQKAVADLLM